MTAPPSKHTRPRHYQGSFWRTRILTMLKYSLIGSAILLLIFLIVWPYAHNGHLFRTLDQVPKKLLPQRKTMLHPHYMGEMKGTGRKLDVRALEAEQSHEDDINLLRPSAELELSDGHTLVVNSSVGTITADQKEALLKGGVTMTHGAGYVVETPAARVLLTEHQAVSDEHVHASGPMGTIEAQGFWVDQDQSRLRFKGKSQLTLNVEGG